MTDSYEFMTNSFYNRTRHRYSYLLKEDQELGEEEDIQMLNPREVAIHNEEKGLPESNS